MDNKNKPIEQYCYLIVQAPFWPTCMDNRNKGNEHYCYLYKMALIKSLYIIIPSTCKKKKKRCCIEATSDIFFRNLKEHVHAYFLLI